MILNLTQHTATDEQRAAGVIDLPPEARECLVRLLTVDALPTRQEIDARCADIAELAASLASPDDREDGKAGLATHAMIGGAPWMMRALEDALLDQGIEPVYAFSVRESMDQPQPDGSVRKVATFRHAGWVRAHS